MNDHLTIGEILAHITPPKSPPKVAETKPQPTQAQASDELTDRSGDAGGSQDPKQRREDDAPPEEVEAVVDPAEEREQRRETRRRKRGRREKIDRSSDCVGEGGSSEPQAAVLAHLERVAMPSVALANRMADEFESQMERQQAELKYARQRANLAWSAVAFMGLALLYLGWWTGGSIEGSRATAQQASDAVRVERQRSAAMAGELGKMREAAERAQTAERERSLELVAKLEAAHDSMIELAQRAADAERRLAQATTRIAELEQRQATLEARRPPAPAREAPRASVVVPRREDSLPDGPVMPEALRRLVEPGEP